MAFIKTLDKIDEGICIFLFSIANKNKYTRKITAIITKLSVYICFLLYMLGYVYMYLNLHKYTYIDAIKYIFVPLTTIIISKMIKKNIDAKRPFEKLNIKSIVYHKKGQSFPSNHSSSATIICIAIFYILKGQGIYLALLAIITGGSRVFSGIHYVKDVLAGFLIGALAGLIGFFIL